MVEQPEQGFGHGAGLDGVHAGVCPVAALCLAAGGALVGRENEVVAFRQRTVDARMGRAPEGEDR